VVNGISTNSVYRSGPSGYLTTFGGTNNWQAGGSGGFQYGFQNFLLFASGGGQRANDYHTPLGSVLNSFARNENLTAGAGWYPSKGWLAFTYGYDRRRHGIPVEPDEVDFESLTERRHAWQARGGLRGLSGLIESGDFAVSYNDYKSLEYEFESDENVTELDSVATNRNFNYRVSLNHQRRSRLSGTFGSSGFTRNFVSTGEEAPAPHTRQHSFAAYGLERVDFERVGLQLGGCVEQYSYNPEGGFRARDFVGFAGSAGVRVPLWRNGVFVANYQRSFRAPALEELYNNGPHPGLLVFDIGNQNLAAEHGDGIELSVRHNAGRVRLEGSAFYYRLGNFVFPAFTGLTDEESGLPIVNYTQGDSRYRGAEASAEARAFSTVWVDAKVDYVQADSMQVDKPLPRIPPLRGTFGLDWRYKGFTVRPELHLANRQDRVYVSILMPQSRRQTRSISTAVVRNSMLGRSRASRSLTSCAVSNFRPHPEQTSFRFPPLRGIQSLSVFGFLVDLVSKLK
jgi:iron complex outermembrane receptor protein